MGNCTTPKVQQRNDNTDISKLNDKISSRQMALLTMIYEDIASRISENEVSIENFLLFFHKNGYWGDRLFKEFDANKSNLISKNEFIKGIIRIFKTSESVKIELLYKFFSDNQINQGISFNSFLTMLYNYPKEDINHILNDKEFIQQEIRKNLVAVNSDISGRRLVSVCPNDLRINTLEGTQFRFEENSEKEDKLESRVGAKIIHELSKSDSKKGEILKFKVGENDIEIKTTSIHYLAKKFAKKIFKDYDLSQSTGKLKFPQFKDWVIKHPNLYKNYYHGFHNEVWEVDRDNGMPLYKSKQMQFSSEAKLQQFGSHNKKCKKVIIALYNSILIVTEEEETCMPLMLISLEGLAVKKYYDQSFGCGIEISHRDGIYPIKIFTFVNDGLRDEWMEYLKFYKGASINQIYETGKKIGIGKFSVVYSCIEKSTGDQYAIKVIESYKLDEDARRLIAHESSIMTILSHPLLVFFKESIQTKTHIYIITELVKGKDLFELIRELKFLGEGEAAFIIQQVIIGVRYIHSLGIVHRDMKPENIMVEYDEEKCEVGGIKIIDFGFANYLEKLRKLSGEELWAGTPNYIAPQVLREENISEKIDNFAIGSILYFLLSGTLPFNSYDLNGILQKTVEGQYNLNTKHWKSISAEAKDLITQLLENDPQDRITLDEALKHEWFEQVRGKDALKMQMISKHVGKKEMKSQVV